MTWSPASCGLPTEPARTREKRATKMSSHREAPGIAFDPVADSADLHAFVSPDDPSTVTLIANYVPFQLAPAGPNFYEFGNDLLY